MRLLVSLLLSYALLAFPLHAGGKKWIPWTTATAGGAAPPYSDDFNRADQNPIAGDWESGLGANGQIKIASAAAAIVSGKGVASVKASALTINSNQSVEIELNSGNYDNLAGPVVRMQSSGAHYRAFWSFTFGQGNIEKVDASGTATEIGSRWFSYPTDSDKFCLEINGTSITAYKIQGGTRTDLKAAETDSTLTGGQPGFWLEGAGTLSSAGAFYAENF